MPYISAQIDVDLDLFDDDVLVYELRSRGFLVSKYDPDLADAAYMALRLSGANIPAQVR